MNKKISICLVSLLLLVTCVSCKANTPYLVKDYLNVLAISSGIGESDNFDDNFNCLLNWKIVDKKDLDVLDNQLDSVYVSKTISRLIEENEEYLYEHLWLKNKDYNIYENQALEIIDKAVELINNKTFINCFDYEYTSKPKDVEDNSTDGDLIYDKENGIYLINDKGVLRPASFEEVYKYLDISNSSEIDFSEAIIIPYEDEPANTSYVNNKFNLLASKTHSYNKDGFHISYTLNGSGISVHLSKNIDGINLYGDVSINNVKPVFKWTYDSGDLKNCFFNIKMNTTEKVGASIGRYKNYKLRFKDLDSSNFKSLLNSMLEPKKDVVEASIPICQIKTPIPNIPNVYLNLDLLVKIYVSGKIEIVLYNAHDMGFETKDGQIRYINDHTNDIDSIIRASGKAALGINAGIDASKYRLFDIELDGGIKAEVKSTMHLYDEDGSFQTVNSDIAYSTLDEIATDNNDIKICGDLSLYWLLDLVVNTPKSMMYKMGFSKTFNIMDEDNQIFNNKHHIENGVFVDHCTRKKKVSLLTTTNENAANKIVLDSYAEVINIGDSYNIVINTLPNGYNETNLLYSSEDLNIASVNNGTVIGIMPGVTKIKVYTSDNKHASYINILVSTG